MDLHLTLTRAFAADYPQEAAAALESRSAEEIADVLHSLPLDTAAGVLQRMAAGSAALVTGFMKAEDAAGLVIRLPLDAALSMLRRMAPEFRDKIVDVMPEEYAKALKAAVGFPPGTAGALMDPRVLALPSDLTADEALKAVRRDAENAHYNIYVVDRDHALVGVLNLREMLLAGPRDRLEAIVQPVRHRLSADVDQHGIVGHPGWREVHSLPVVDRRGRFLGAIRYRTLSRLTNQLTRDDFAPGAATVRALGDLIWTGVGGVIDAIASTLAPDRGAGLTPRAPLADSDENEQRDSRMD